MITALAILIFLISIGLLIGYAVQIRREKEKYLSKRELRRIAKEAVQQSKKQDTFITCDYCGARIDTTVYSVCPQCGGAFAKDEEWEQRHEIDGQKVQTAAEKQYAAKRKKLEDQIEKPRKHIRRIALISVLVLAVAASGVWSTYRIRQSILFSPDTLPSGYAETEYAFDDPVLLEEEGVSVRFGRIYKKEYQQGPNNYALELRVQNTRTENIYVTMRIGSVNNRVKNGMLYQSPVAAGTEEIRRIIYLHGCPYPEIKTVQLIDLVISNEQSAPICGVTQPLILETTSLYAVTQVPSGEEVLYENEQAEISITRARQWKDSTLIIKNKGTVMFTLDTTAVANDKEVYSYLYDTVLPGSTGEYRVGDIFPSSVKDDVERVQLGVKGQDLYTETIWDAGYLDMK